MKNGDLQIVICLATARAERRRIEVLRQKRDLLSDTSSSRAAAIIQGRLKDVREAEKTAAKKELLKSRADSHAPKQTDERIDLHATS